MIFTTVKKKKRKKRFNISSEWEEKQSGTERVFKETMAENLPNSAKR